MRRESLGPQWKWWDRLCPDPGVRRRRTLSCARVCVHVRCLAVGCGEQTEIESLLEDAGEYRCEAACTRACTTAFRWTWLVYKRSRSVWRRVGVGWVRGLQSWGGGAVPQDQVGVGLLFGVLERKIALAYTGGGGGWGVS